MAQSTAVDIGDKATLRDTQDPGRGRGDPSSDRTLVESGCPPRDAWPLALAQIQQRINGQSYNTWFRQLHCTGGDARSLSLAVPSKFHLDWVQDHYASFIAENLRDLCGHDVELRLSVAPELIPIVDDTPEPPAMAGVAPTEAAARQPHDRLNARYTFDSFVTGPSNQFARAACEAVAENPAQAYNPLFLYGGVGLGKTHLLHAIGLGLLQRAPATKIIYVTTEEFMNDLIDSMRHEKMGAFRARYRSQCDVLMVDDIQFLTGKERTQEEFFHTFNFLFESHRQIVITSDKFPHEIPGLEERLRTRFQCGLIADIQAPEMETRVAILRAKAENDQIHLPDEVALFLATTIKSNVRELEGSLIRLQAYASLTNQPISLEMAKDRLKGLVSSSEKAVSAEQVQKLVASYFSLKTSDLRSQRRHRAVSLPRQIAMYICRKHCNLSFPEIGERFGGKDHTTVMSAVRKIEGKLPNDAQISKAVAAIESSLWT
ncbi:MAG: chromosomal replication initiator protein DnaA [Pseudomonadota bacterium]